MLDRLLHPANRAGAQLQATHVQHVERDDVAASNFTEHVFDRYWAFGSGAPNQLIGCDPIEECAPCAPEYEAYLAMYSLTSTLDTLSSSKPPYSSGISMESKPSSPALRSSERIIS